MADGAEVRAGAGAVTAAAGVIAGADTGAGGGIGRATGTGCGATLVTVSLAGIRACNAVRSEVGIAVPALPASLIRMRVVPVLLLLLIDARGGVAGRI